MTAAPAEPLPAQGTSRLHVLILVLILALSAFVQATTVSQTTVISPLRADAAEYFSYAFNLREYGVYSILPTWNRPTRPPTPTPDDLRSPGYPLLLAAVGVPEPWQAYVDRVLYLQAMLGVLSVWLSYLIAARVTTPATALGVAFLVAITPHLATINTYLLSEGLFLFLLSLSTYLLIRAADTPRRWLYAASGAVLALCTLVRLTTLYLPAVLLVLVLVLPRLRAFRTNALVGAASFLLVFSPWIIRNHQPGVQNVGSGLMVKTLVHGSYPNFEYNGRRETFGFPYRFDPEAERISRDVPSIVRHVIAKFREAPATYLRWYLIGKPGYFLAWGGVQAVDILIYPVARSPFYDRPLFRGMRTVSLWLHWPLMLLGMLGAFLVLVRPAWLGLDGTRRFAATIVALVVAYAVAFHMVAAPIPRYSIPFRPLIFLLAALPVHAGWRWLARRRTASAPST